MKIQLSKPYFLKLYHAPTVFYSAYINLNSALDKLDLASKLRITYYIYFVIHQGQFMPKNEIYPHRSVGRIALLVGILRDLLFLLKTPPSCADAFLGQKYCLQNFFHYKKVQIIYFFMLQRNSTSCFPMLTFLIAVILKF